MWNMNVVTDVPVIKPQKTKSKHLPIQALELVE